MVLTFKYKAPEDRFRIPVDLTGIPAIEEFVGRGGDLDRLWGFLKPRQSNIRKVLVLYGLGGIGKTQLAIRFARMHKDDFTAIFWLNGKDRGTLVQSLASVLPKLPGTDYIGNPENEEVAEQQARQTLKWLAADGNSKWLLIFDNIGWYSSRYAQGREGYDIAEFFPPADHGSIIITTRLAQLRELGKSYPVKKLSTEEAVELLINSSGYTCETSLDPGELLPLRAYLTLAGIVLLHYIDIANLAHRLDGLPLAIVIAGSFICSTGTTFAKYLHLYDQSWCHLQSNAEPQHQYSHGNLLSTWKISYSEIQQRDPSAAKLLLLFSYFNNRDIWFQLIENGLKSSNPPEWFCNVISSEMAFLTAIKTLISFSFIESRHKVNSYSMHPVVQDWCQHSSSEIDEDSQIELKTIVLASVGYTVPLSTEKKYWVLQQRLLPHVNQMVKVLQNGWNYIPQDPTIPGAIYALGNLYFDQGKLKEAEAMYQRALTGNEKALGPDHTSTLETVRKLGTLYFNQGKLKEAEVMYQRALTGNEKALGPDHPSTLNTIHNLGYLYSDRGKLKEAEVMYQRALTGNEKALGPDHTSTLKTVHNLGILYFDQGKLKEAEAMYQRALTGNEKALGPDHTLTLLTVYTLGTLYRGQGKLKEAEAMYQRALTGNEKALGPEHTSTLNTVCALGILYYNQGKLKEAEVMYQRALAGKEKVLGPDHPSTLNAIHNLGYLYFDQGKLKEAEAMYQRALTGNEKALGRDHPSTLNNVYSLGNLYYNQGKLKEAEAMYQRALTDDEKALGPDHISTLMAVNALGNLYSYQGKLKEAEAMYQL
jgi:tetratricopeptide (TPR) repeat protein